MNKKRLICFFTIIMVIFYCFCPVVLATDENNTITDKSTQIKCGTTTQMIADRVSTISRRTGETLVVAAVKEIHDFSDNLYYAVEFEPAGYLICNAEHGNIIEYSTSSQSPYQGYDNNLYYGGPTYYYTESWNSFSHTFYHEEIPFSDTTTISQLENGSDDMNNRCLSFVEYLVNNREDDISEIDLSVLSCEAPQKGAPTGTVYYVGSYNAGQMIKALENGDQMGYYCPYNSNGVCGYIASGLMLYWIDECMGNDRFINDFSYIKGNHTGFINGNLTRELRSYGDADDTSATGLFGASLQDILAQYASMHYLSIDTTPHTFISNSSIKSALQSTNKPVIVTGYLSKDESNYYFHVVLAYGYTSNNEIVVHFGHPSVTNGSNHYSYSNIVLSYQYGIAGTFLRLNNFSAQTISFVDIPDYDWAYNAAEYCTRYHIIERYSNGRFYPDSQIDRGNFIKALYTLAGKPEVSGNHMSGFTDAPASTSQLYDSTNWAVFTGVLTGVNSTTLALDQPLKREQAVTFLYRFSNVLGCTFSNITGPSAIDFADYYSISEYARHPMNWATTRYLVNGSNGNLNPQSLLKRSQAAQLLYKMSIYASR